MLQLGTKSLVPTAAEDLAEQAAMKELHQTYGKVSGAVKLFNTCCSQLAPSYRPSTLGTSIQAQSSPSALHP